MATAFANGDVETLNIADNGGTVFFWIMHNGTIDGSCADSTYKYVGGKPGLGIAADNNGTPTLTVGTWSGGSLPAFSTGTSDNFTRPNAGWLGVNWWFPWNAGNNIGDGMVISSNSAVIANISPGSSMAVWTTPFGSTQASKVNVGTLTGSPNWVAASVRNSWSYSTQLINGSGYFALVEPSGVVDLFEYALSGGNITYNQLGSSLGTFGGTVNTLELDASGTSPVALVVKINGTQYGSTYNDSTYLLTGAYEGFGIANTTSQLNVAVTNWVGN